MYSRFLVFFPPFPQELGTVEDQEEGDHQNGIAPEVVPQESLEEVERVTLSGLTEEHEVGAKDRIGRHRHSGEASKKQEAAGEVPPVPPELPGVEQQDGVAEQEAVDGEGVDHHEVGPRQGRPGDGEEEGRRGRDDAEGIEEVLQELRGFPGVEGDKEDVDAAKVQGQVAGVEVFADQEPGVLKELVRDGEEGETSPDPLPSSLVAPPVEAAEGENGQGDAAQPAEVEGVEVGESPSRRGWCRWYPENAA